MRTSTPLTLPNQERAELEMLARRAVVARTNRGARIILWLADGCSYTGMRERVACTAQTIATWKARYQADGVRGLRGRHRGSKPRVHAAGRGADLELDAQAAHTDGSTHWSTRVWAASWACRTRSWRAHGSAPACSRTGGNAICDRLTPMSTRTLRRSIQSTSRRLATIRLPNKRRPRLRRFPSPSREIKQERRPT